MNERQKDILARLVNVLETVAHDVRDEEQTSGVDTVDSLTAIVGDLGVTPEEMLALREGLKADI